MRGTCDACRNQRSCAECGKPVAYFDHVGVRASSGSKLSSGIWHVASPCGHAQKLQVKAAAGPSLAVYNGGPLWKPTYKWQSIYWGTYWQRGNLPFTPDQVDKAVIDIERDASYSGGLSEYNVAQGSVLPRVIIAVDPASTIDDSQIGLQIAAWIQARLIPELGQQGAYNIFFPPGTSVTLQGSASCQTFCDFHNFDGTHFYTVEPYPCSSGCNQCTSNRFDTLTMGLSEEMIELKSDANPGTGWVIGNEELCVPPDTLLLGDNKLIRDYATGDKVIGVTGIQEVKNVFVRPHRGTMTQVRGSGMLPLKATPGHPVLVVSSIKGKLTAPYWKRISAVRPKRSSQDGDYLLLPVLEGKEHTVEFALDTSHRTMKPKISRLVLDRDVAWLLGTYVAEGFAETANKIHWALDEDEVELAKRILEILKRLGAKGWVSHAKGEASIVVHASSLTLKRFFVEHCGRGTENKQIPDFILYHANKELLASFVEGYLRGDGSRYANRNLNGRVYWNNAFNTTSKKLGLQLQLAAARLGKFVPLHRYHHDGVGYVQGRKVVYHEGVQGKFYDSHSNKRRRWKNVMGGKFMALPVAEKTQVPYLGQVYNIATDDHSYLISNVVTHNCDYCDASFVCKQIAEGEYVNAWYSNAKGACWIP